MSFADHEDFLDDPEEDALASPPPTPAPSSVPTLTRYSGALVDAGSYDGITIKASLVREYYPAADVDALLRAQQDELRVTDELLKTRQQLLDLFDCPVHGPSCVPHAIREVRSLRARAQALREKLQPIIDAMRAERPRYKSHDLGFVDSVSANSVDDWAKELGHLLTGPEA